MEGVQGMTPDASPKIVTQEKLDALEKRLIEGIGKSLHHVGECRFDDGEAKRLHLFVNSLEDGGWEKWVAILAFGATLIQIRKAGTIALVGLIATSVCGALWAGFKLVLVK